VLALPAVSIVSEYTSPTTHDGSAVSPVFGKPAGSGMEVLVQGKQGPAVVDYLIGKGIPKRWIEVTDLAGKK